MRRADLPVYAYVNPRAFSAGALIAISANAIYMRPGAVMGAADIEDGPHATAKGLRHGYGVHAIGCGVPLNLLSRWMGHASLEATAVYADALGAEEQAIASKMWVSP